VANNLKISSTKAIEALHKFVFEQKGDRSNRKQLRKFKGFPFANDSDEYRSKIVFVEANLGKSSLSMQYFSNRLFWDEERIESVLLSHR